MKTIQQRFNEYCADVMGYYKSGDIYFTPTHIAIAKYDPWNDDEQLMNVACVLADNGKLPHNLDVRMSSIQVSIAEVRDYVRKNLMDENKEVIKGCVGKERFWEDEVVGREASVVLNDIRRRKAEDEAKSEEFKMNQFNEHCANIMGWERRGNMHYDGEGKCIGDVSFYNPYESSGDLQPVLDVLRVVYGLVPTGSSSHAGRDLVWWYVVYGDECPKNVEDTVEENHPYEQCAVLADKKDEEDRRKLFNDHCAAIMDWHLGADKLIADIYFDNFGNVVAHVDNWNPYDSTEQMQPILDVASKMYGLTIFPNEIFERSMLDVAREKILAVTLSQESEDDVLDVEEGWDKHDRLHPITFDTIGGIPYTVEHHPVGAAKEPVDNLDDAMKIVEDCTAQYDKIRTFNDYCAELMGWHRGTGCYSDSYYKLEQGALMGSYMGQVQEYNPYDDLTQIEPVVKVIGDLSVFVDEWVEAAHGRLYACRAAVNEVMSEDEDVSVDDDWDILGEDIGNDVHAACKKISDAIGADLRAEPDYPNVFEEQEKFNAQCRDIMFKHSANQGGSLLLAQAFDPYYNGTQLINILEIVLRYIPNSIHCMIAAGQSDTEGDEDITNGLDVAWHMRKFIESYGTDEWMTKPLGVEETFNNMCKELCEGYNIMPTDENYNPYDYIGDLAPILPVIIRRVDEPFTIPGIMNDMPGEHRYNCDIHDNMVHYVSRHGETVLGFLEYDDE